MTAIVRADDTGRSVLFDPRWEEVWQRKIRGQTYAEISRDMAVNRHTVVAWYKKYSAIMVERKADADGERYFLIGRLEELARKSIDAFDTALHEPDVNWHTDPRPAHMANAIKALQQIARLSGFDVRQSINLHQHKGESEITIKVGGETMVSRRVRRLKTEGVTGEAIQVAAREVVRAGDGPGGAPASEDGEASGDG